MKKLLFLPALLLSACGDNLAADDEQSSAGAESAPGPEEDEEEVSRTLQADIYIEMPSCTDALARYEASAGYDDGTPASVTCKWTFDDGNTSDSCAGEHIFEEGGFHDFILDVTDPLTGQTARATQRRNVEPPHVANLEVTAPACGLEFSYKASVSTTSFNHISVVEQDKVLPFEHTQLENTVQVTEPGTYTVVYYAEDERSIPICLARVEKKVTVTACHDHTPDCEH